MFMLPSLKGYWLNEIKASLATIFFNRPKLATFPLFPHLRGTSFELCRCVIVVKAS